MGIGDFFAPLLKYIQNTLASKLLKASPSNSSSGVNNNNGNTMTTLKHSSSLPSGENHAPKNVQALPGVTNDTINARSAADRIRDDERKDLTTVSNCDTNETAIHSELLRTTQDREDTREMRLSKEDRLLNELNESNASDTADEFTLSDVINKM